MDSKKSNKIRDIVRLQQILKKWRKVANASHKNTITSTTTTTTTGTGTAATTITTSTSNGGSSSGNKGIKFLRKTLSFSDNTSSSSVTSASTTEYVPKGYLAVCVGKELKRYVIPTDYLGHQAFIILLREAEEEFGFHQEGVLKIPCDVAVFEKILQMVQHKREEFFFHEFVTAGSFEFHASDIDVMSSTLSGCCSPDSDQQLLQPSLPQLCR